MNLQEIMFSEVEEWMSSGESKTIFLDGKDVVARGDTVYTIDWLTTPQFIIGSLVFIAGAIINKHSDTLLIRLRKPNETGYKIPQGGLFEYVSCPNLFGEVVQWLGFAILTWSLPGLAFFVWTFANLVPRALSHHKWYLNHFQDYPKKRKAIIPFVL